MEESVQQRAKEILDEESQLIYRRVDKMFAVLLLTQWVVAILGAYLISPLTWVGTISSPHIHLWSALLMGATLTIFPLILVLMAPGQPITRHVITVAQMLFSALLIHITGGRIETHFHVFGSLAFLGFYRDWRILITATVTIVLDHFLRGIFWPLSVYGVLTAPLWRSFEHAGWVLFQVSFIIFATRSVVKDMHESALKTAELENMKKKIELKVYERTRKLHESNRELIVLNKKVRENQTQLLQAQKLEAIGQLAAGIAHEINTPTQYIGDNTKFLQDSFKEILEVSKETKELIDLTAQTNSPELYQNKIKNLEKIYQKADMAYLVEEIPSAIRQSLEGIERVSEIVRAMKEFSHPGSYEKTPVDLNHALQTTITVARNEWKYVADIETIFDKELPLVSCLPGEINQVFLNVIVNAAHAISDKIKGEGKGKIIIQTKGLGDSVEIKITDTGSGMPEKVKMRIFDPFFTTKEVGKGTGQGLTISRSVIVDKHKGAIEFESKEGEGTTFIIRLPIVQEPSLGSLLMQDLSVGSLPNS